MIASRARVVDVGDAAAIPRTIAHWLQPARMTLSAASGLTAAVLADAPDMTKPPA
ncbi:hypothetical protein ACPESV_31755 [Streptomyces umbrinus]|uniref:hypothetical protein n=1 Tax=Streptomyces umbrinus TaxID=67370 RepID=UPI003C2BFEC1